MEDVTVQHASRDRWIMAAVAFASFICSLDTYIVCMSLPSMAGAFNVGTGEVSLVVIAYLLVMTTTIPLSKKLSETFGFIRVLTAGHVAFTAGLVLCSISGSMEMLIASRCVEALGASILFAIPAAFALRHLSGDSRKMAYRLMAVSSAIGLCAGAPVGGLISAHLTWHWIFIVQIPPSILAIFGVLRLSPLVQKELTPPGSFDIFGFILSFLGLATLLFALNTGAEAGWSSPLTLFLITLALAFIAAFIHWERRHSEPIMAPELYTSRNFAIASLASTLLFMAVAGNAFLLPFYLSLCKGFRADKAGFLVMLFPLAMMAAATLGEKAALRTSPRVLCSVATISSAAAWLYFSGSLYLDGVMQVVVFLLWAGSSAGLFISPNSSLFIDAVAPDRMGAAYVVFRTFNSLGSLLGVSLFETVFSQAFSELGGVDGAQSILSQVPVNIFLSGFFNSYVFGAAVLACALVFTLLLRESGKSGEES
jgi:EmrB/QacA subfamily drug resistance transporter